MASKEWVLHSSASLPSDLTEGPYTAEEAIAIFKKHPELSHQLLSNQRLSGYEVTLSQLAEAYEATYGSLDSQPASLPPTSEPNSTSVIPQFRISEPESEIELSNPKIATGRNFQAPPRPHDVLKSLGDASLLETTESLSGTNDATDSLLRALQAVREKGTQQVISTQKLTQDSWALASENSRKLSPATLRMIAIFIGVIVLGYGVTKFFKSTTPKLAKEDSPKNTDTKKPTSSSSSPSSSGTLLSTGNVPAATKPPVTLPSGGAVRMGERPTPPQPFENPNSPDPNPIPEAPLIEDNYTEEMPFDPNYPTDLSDETGGIMGGMNEDGSSAMNPYPNEQPGGFNGGMNGPSPHNKMPRPFRPQNGQPPLDPAMQGMPPMHGGH